MARTREQHCIECCLDQIRRTGSCADEPPARITVKLTGLHGEHRWFCDEHWEANRREHEAFTEFLEDGLSRMGVQRGSTEAFAPAP
jgi:hypothetical protein